MYNKPDCLRTVYIDSPVLGGWGLVGPARRSNQNYLKNTESVRGLSGEYKYQKYPKLFLNRS